MLYRDAAVLNFLQREEGFLFGDVFIGMQNSVIKLILKKEGTEQGEVAKALYQIEKRFNLMGLNLRENQITESVIYEKVLEAYDPVIDEVDFEILSNGIAVEDEVDEKANERSVQDTLEQEGALNQLGIGDFLEKIANRKSNSDSGDSESFGDPIDTDVTDFASSVVASVADAFADASRLSVDNVGADVSTEKTLLTGELNLEGQKLSREEKRILTNKGILEAFKANDILKLAEIVEFVKNFVEVSDTTVRNILIEMSEEGKITQLKRGVYQMAGSQVVPVNEEELEKQPVVEQPAMEQTVAQQAAAQQLVMQPEVNQQPVVQMPNTIKTNEKTILEMQRELAQLRQMVQNNSVQKIQNKVSAKVETAKLFPPLYSENGPIIEYLKERGVRKTLIDFVVRKRSDNAKRLENQPQDVIDKIEVEPTFIGKVSVLEKALTSMMRNSPLSLKGEAGTGKTTLVQTISALLNLPLFSVNGSLDSNKATLIGEKDIDENRLLITKDGQMTKAMKIGGILYVDEINMMRPDILSLINPATDHRRTFHNDVSKETVVGHKEFRFVSAMNVGYAGVKKMNEATMDRTGAIVLTYLGKTEMKSLLTSIAEKENVVAAETGSPEIELTAIDIAKLTKIYLVLTSEAKRGTIPMLAASTRNIILLAKYAPVLGYQMALEMMLEKFDEEAANIVGVLGKDELLEKDLGINPNELLMSIGQ